MCQADTSGEAGSTVAPRPLWVRLRRGALGAALWRQREERTRPLRGLQVILRHALSCVDADILEPAEPSHHAQHVGVHL